MIGGSGSAERISSGIITADGNIKTGVGREVGAGNAHGEVIGGIYVSGIAGAVDDEANKIAECRIATYRSGHI